MKYKFWKLPIAKDSRGALCPVEFSALPFKPKRIYFLYDTKALRGGHAHIKEEEVFICIKGSFRATIHDGHKKRSYKMDKPGQALYTANLVWHEFDKFSPGAVMLAISSTKYEGRKGYIMGIDQFKDICRKKS